MLRPPRPDNESARLAALRAARLLDTPREQAFDDLVRLASVICRTSMAAATLVDEDRQWFKAQHGFSTRQSSRDESVCAHAIVDPAGMMEVPDLAADPRFGPDPIMVDGNPVRFYAGVPMRDADGLALGTLCVLDSAPGLLSEDQAQALAALARQASHLIQLRRAGLVLERHQAEREWFLGELDRYANLLEAENASLVELSRTDPLTGLGNRRAFGVALDAAIASAAVVGAPVSIALLDLDHFKTVNDLNGHALGDQVLAELGRLLKSHFAAAGTVARYGGEEFALLLPDTPLDVAVLQCELLRQQVAAMPLGVVVTASVGVAQWVQGETPEQTLARADSALYRAKLAGRDRVQTDPA